MGMYFIWVSIDKWWWSCKMNVGCISDQTFSWRHSLSHCWDLQRRHVWLLGSFSPGHHAGESVCSVWETIEDNVIFHVFFMFKIQSTWFACSEFGECVFSKTLKDLLLTLVLRLSAEVSLSASLCAFSISVFTHPHSPGVAYFTSPSYFTANRSRSLIRRRLWGTRTRICSRRKSTVSLPNLYMHKNLDWFFHLFVF